MIDEEDLRKKYASKPQQLANILKNATTKCNIRDAWLYAEPNYELQESEEKQQTKQRAYSGKTEETIKKERKQSESCTGRGAKWIMQRKQKNDATKTAMQKNKTVGRSSSGRMWLPHPT